MFRTITLAGFAALLAATAISLAQPARAQIGNIFSDPAPRPPGNIPRGNAPPQDDEEEVPDLPQQGRLLPTPNRPLPGQGVPPPGPVQSQPLPPPAATTVVPQNAPGAPGQPLPGVANAPPANPIWGRVCRRPGRYSRSPCRLRRRPRSFRRTRRARPASLCPEWRTPRRPIRSGAGCAAARAGTVAALAASGGDHGRSAERAGRARPAFARSGERPAGQSDLGQGVPPPGPVQSQPLPPPAATTVVPQNAPGAPGQPLPGVANAPPANPIWGRVCRRPGRYSRSPCRLRRRPRSFRRTRRARPASLCPEWRTPRRPI